MKIYNTLSPYQRHSGRHCIEHLASQSPQLTLLGFAQQSVLIELQVD
jgi:hypothetical protein